MLKKTLKINGITKTVIAASEASLATVLREQLGLTGTKVGCGEGQCGACNVILDGKLIRSCVTKMGKVPDGAAITTVEGIGTPENLHPVQLAWVVHGGAPAHWVGREAMFREQVNRFRQSWQGLGRPRVVAACATCLLMLKEHLPKTGAVSLWEVLVESPLPQFQFRPEVPLAVHDPCTSRGDARAQSAVRRLPKGLHVPFTELELGRDKTECCGFGGLMENANPSLAREVVVRRASRSDADYLAYCAMCRDSLASVGKRVIHVLDLFFPPGDGDPAQRPRTGWSERQENRARLHTLSVSAMAFQDVWNLDIDRLRDCCIHIMMPDRCLAPFCAYNLTAADGRGLYRPDCPSPSERQLV